MKNFNKKQSVFKLYQGKFPPAYEISQEYQRKFPRQQWIDQNNM